MNAYQTFKTALNSDEFSDFQNIIMGGTRTLNGPQGGFCFCLDALDNAQFGLPQVPPAPRTARDQNATEFLEHYWASLLRDVAFTDYPSNSIAVQAAAELGSQPTYLWSARQRRPGHAESSFPGQFPRRNGEAIPLSFFFCPPSSARSPSTSSKSLISRTSTIGTSFAEWLDIQNGVDTGFSKPSG